jgi:hypothetical protein
MINCQKNKKKLPTAILLISDKKIGSLKNVVILENPGYKGDIIKLETAEKAIDYLVGITSDFLPGLLEEPYFLVFLDLTICKNKEWCLLSNHLTLSEQKRSWFKFVVFGSANRPSDKEIALRYSSVMHFEYKPLTRENILIFFKLFQELIY